MKKKITVISIFLVLSFISFRIAKEPILASHRSKHLKSAVSIEWDSAGVPHIQADHGEDVYFVQGFVTARDRFFQMDLGRRKMAGTLTELFGDKALASDIKARKWNYRKAARRSVEVMPPLSRQRLNSYAEGVNAFLASHSRPWEYFVLRSKPLPWKPEDSFLILLSMYDSLNHHDSLSELAYPILRAQLNSKALNFLTSEWGFFDTPTLGGIENLSPPSLPSLNDFKVSPEFNLDKLPSKLNLGDLDKEPGSNAWVISGKLSPSGKPLLASDPHLDLRVPNLWYRTDISVGDTNVRGVSIPGIPGVVIGRNHHLAWSFTNSAVDNSDRVLIDTSSALVTKREEIFSFHGETLSKEVFYDSPWGPVFSEPEGRSYAVQWTALDPLNLKTLDLTEINQARNSRELLTAFQAWAGPAQNMVFATVDGEIGWTLVGKIPNRRDFDGRLPSEIRKEPLWQGYLSSSEVPQVINPKAGFIVNANQRTLPIDKKYLIFGHHWPNAARARRIMNRLKESSHFSVSEMSAIQNDNLSLTHLYYRDELTRCLESDESEQLSYWVGPLSAWTGHTDLDSKIFPLLREFRFEVMNTLIAPIAWTLSAEKSELLISELNRDELIKRLIDANAPHLLAPQFSQTCEALLFAFKTTLSKFSATRIEDLPSWGSVNLSAIEHPFGRLLPRWLKPTLNFPQVPLAGDYLVPRVMTPSNGASMRLVIDLGDFKQSVFSQPGGQSGSPFSSHYQDLFSGWVSGKTVPFEATPTSKNELFLPLLY